MKKIILFFITILLFSCTGNNLKNTVWGTAPELNEYEARNLYNYVTYTLNCDIGAYSDYIDKIKSDTTRIIRLFDALAHDGIKIQKEKYRLYHSKYTLEFLTDEKCIIKDEYNTIFCIYKFENSNLVLYYDMPNGNRIIYDMGTIENNNCIKLRKIAAGNCFTKIKIQ